MQDTTQPAKDKDPSKTDNVRLQPSKDGHLSTGAVLGGSEEQILLSSITCGE